MIFYRWHLPTLLFLLAAITDLLIPMPCQAQTSDLTLTAADGYQIAATLTRPEKKTETAGVVLIHMYRNTKESWEPLTRVLADRGITSLTIDLRGHGESRFAPDGSDDSIKVTNRDSSFFDTMHLDAETALEYLEKDEHITTHHIGLVGASVGCSIAIQTAVNSKVAAVAVMTPGRDYLGIQTMDHIKNWPGTPLLILTSEEEKNRGAVDIYTALQNRGAELKIFKEESIHGTNMFGEVDNVEQIITGWLSNLLQK